MNAFCKNSNTVMRQSPLRRHRRVAFYVLGRISTTNSNARIEFGNVITAFVLYKRSDLTRDQDIKMPYSGTSMRHTTPMSTGSLHQIQFEFRS